MSSTPTPPPALDAASRKSLRDLLFAWLYISVSQVDTIGTRNADDIIADLKSSISVPPGSQIDQDIRTWITQIQANPAAYTTVATTLKDSGTTDALTVPWSGTPIHPSLDELNLTLANV